LVSWSISAATQLWRAGTFSAQARVQEIRWSVTSSNDARMKSRAEQTSLALADMPLTVNPMLA
jgi:hypothetical protein